MRATFFSALVVLLSLQCYSQVTDLSIIGQTVGGAGFHVNWDSTGQKLIVGAGTTLQVYNMNDPEHPDLIAQRPLKGLINETEVYGNVIFAAATHDGLIAMDYSSPNLDIIAQIDMHNSGDTAAYDMWRCNDTIYLADNFRVRRYKFTGTGFIKLSSFGPYNSFCVARKGNYIVVGGQSYPYAGIFNPWKGGINLYHVSDLTTPLAVWRDTLINYVQDVQFADLRNDIIYVCAGPQNVLFTETNLIALHYDGSSLSPVDTFHLEGGILGFAQLNIMNLDSRNDTLYVVTTAATNTSVFPLAYMPIIDATGLPTDTMRKIGEVVPGLWHFDAALMDGTPYIAMSSEWCGFLVSDISQLNPYDTLVLYETGGWCVNNHVKDGLLWACHEGNGLIVYDPDSLMFINGFHCQSRRMHLYDITPGNHFFCFDVEFLNDTLMMVNSSEVYNLNPWFSGGPPLKIADMNKNWMNFMRNIQTNTGQRMVATFDNLIGGKWLSLFDPFDAAGGYPDLDTVVFNSDAAGMWLSGDTVYYGKTYNNLRYLCAMKVVNDQFVFLDTFKLNMGFSIPGLDHEIHSISIENGIIAVAYGQQFAWFNWNGNELNQVGYNYQPSQVALAISLRNDLVYIADRFYGVKVYDVSNPPNTILVAQCRGTGGWKNLYGSDAVTVADDGKIYLSDFHAGVFIIEAYDTTTINIGEHSAGMQNELTITYPNPSNDKVIIEKTSGMPFGNCRIIMFDLNGKVVSPDVSYQSDKIVLDCTGLKRGMYSYLLTEDGKRLSAGKIIISTE